jgi:hypothetical protein
MGFDATYFNPPFIAYSAPPAYSDAALRETCILGWRLAEIILGHYRNTREAPSCKDTRHHPIKPTKAQTDNGLFLVVGDQMQMQLNTPLGAFSFKGPDSGKPLTKFVQAACKGLELKPLVPRTPYNGAIFMVLGVGGVTLNPPRWLMHRHFRESQWCISKWEEFKPVSVRA